MKILHISDAHFGFHKNKDGSFKTTEIKGKNYKLSSHCFVTGVTKSPDPDFLAKKFLKDEQITGAPQLVVISGDLGWSGDQADYVYALKFLRKLRKKWTDTLFCIVPGNHDAELLDESQSENNRQNNFLKLLKDFYGEDKVREYFPFLSKKEIKDHKLKDRDNLTFIYLGNSCSVVGFNSAASLNSLSCEPNISTKILEKVAVHIEANKPTQNTASIARIATFHHHLLPFIEHPSWREPNVDVNETPRLDTSILSNSATVQSWLRCHKFDIVLHGHKHIFHAREDALWVDDETDPRRRMAVIGAGSCGVDAHHLAHGDKHTFNLLDVDAISCENLFLEVRVAKIDMRKLDASPSYGASRLIRAGADETQVPDIFEGSSIAYCHRSISRHSKNAGVIHNFQSRVPCGTLSDFDAIETGQIGEKTIGKREFELCFAALYPNWKKSGEWSAVDTNIPHRDVGVSIRHDARLFRQIEVSPGEFKTPISIAIERPKTRRFVSLFDAELEVDPRATMMPGLMGVQFCERPKKNGSSDVFLDIVLTFRNLELSFWWIVNQLEAIRLLGWGLRKLEEQNTEKSYVPGDVIFFSALAEWLGKSPNPPFEFSLEKKSYDTILQKVVVDSVPNKQEKTKEIQKLLLDYCERLNKNNIYISGLMRLRDSIYSVNLAAKNHLYNTSVFISDDTVEKMDEVLALLQEAIKSENDRGHKVDSAKIKLGELLAYWKRDEV